MAVTVFHELLALMVQTEASDVHIKTDAPAVFRINNELTDTSFVPDAETMNAFLDQQTTPEQREEYRKHGDLDISLLEDEIGRFRVNIHRQRNSDSINMRWVKNTIKTFKELGLPETLSKISMAERGIIFITGTTGSGKSTTLAAMLEYINATARKHIVTIEDPIEYEFRDNLSVFEQREVGIDTSSFNSALTHVLRQDPDIIVVGEMRDRESFNAVLSAADTGHLVISTVHATNAYLTINRLLDFYQKGEQDSIRESLANNLHSIISQRLITKVFGNGRIPAWEIMVNTPAISGMIRENRLAELPSVIAGGKEDGMETFNQCLFNLVSNGLISEEDALTASDNPEALQMNFNGIFLSSQKGGITG